MSQGFLTFPARSVRRSEKSQWSHGDAGRLRSANAAPLPYHGQEYPIVNLTCRHRRLNQGNACTRSSCFLSAMVLGWLLTTERSTSLLRLSHFFGRDKPVPIYFHFFSMIAAAVIPAPTPARAINGRLCQEVPFVFWILIVDVAGVDKHILEVGQILSVVGIVKPSRYRCASKDRSCPISRRSCQCDPEW